MDLFEYMSMQRKKEESPLAVRMRPKNLDEVVGQQHIIGKDKLLLYFMGMIYNDNHNRWIIHKKERRFLCEHKN